MSYPDCRKSLIPIDALYTFQGPFGSSINDVTIPPLLIKKFAGEDWITNKFRESAAAVEMMASEENGVYLDLSNLILILRGKVYPDLEPARIVGFVSQILLIDMSNAIRTRLLEITIEIANKIPNAAGVELTSIMQDPEVTTQIFNQTIHGSMINIQSSGPEATIQVTIAKHDSKSLKNGLSKFGLPEEESRELANLIAEQEPKKQEDGGLNDGVRKWLADRITNGFDAGFKGGISVLTQFVQEAAMQY